MRHKRQGRTTTSLLLLIQSYFSKQYHESPAPSRLEQKPQLTTCKSSTSFLWKSQGLPFVACGRLKVWSHVLQVHMHGDSKKAGWTHLQDPHCMEGWSGGKRLPCLFSIEYVSGWGCAMHVRVSVLLEKNQGLILGFSMR